MTKPVIKAAKTQPMTKITLKTSPFSLSPSLELTESLMGASSRHSSSSISTSGIPLPLQRISLLLATWGSRESRLFNGRISQSQFKGDKVSETPLKSFESSKRFSATFLPTTFRFKLISNSSSSSRSKAPLSTPTKRSQPSKLRAESRLKAPLSILIKLFESATSTRRKFVNVLKQPRFST